MLLGNPWRLKIDTFCVHRLRGMFAFAIWDDIKKQLFCARDRVGIKPFYYTLQNNRFIFGSDIKTILASKLYQAEINIEGLYHCLSFGVAPRPLTCFKGIEALPQAHWMLIDQDGKCQQAPYWSVPIGTQDQSLSLNDSVDLIEEKLTQSVKRRLVSDVSVGTFMSGGIDSTLITAIAAKQHPGIKAFTLGYEGYADDYNEVPQAQATARMYPLEHIIKTIRAESLLEHIETNILNYEEPFYSLSPNFLISQLVKENDVTVVLNGLGGDELFAGYRHSKWANRRWWMKLAAPFFSPLKNVKDVYARISDLRYATTADKHYNVLFTIMSEHMKQKLMHGHPVNHLNSIEATSELYVKDSQAFTDNIEAMCYMDLMHYIGNHHVYRIDQFTMAFSLEGRFPFLDHEVIEAAFRIPSKHKIHRGEQKYVLKQLAKKYIAPECIAMKKKGFSLPMAHWIKNELNPYALSKLEALAQRDLFCKKTIWDIWDNFNKGTMDSRYVWQLVSVEAWLELFFNR